MINIQKAQIDKMLEARVEGDAWFSFDDLKQKRAIQNTIDLINIKMKDDYKIQLSDDVIEIENHSILLAVAYASYAVISEGSISAKKLQNLGGVILEDGNCEDECGCKSNNWNLIAELLRPYAYMGVRKIPVLVSH